MVKVKSTEDIKANYTSGATVAPQRYSRAVSQTSGVIQAAIDAESRYAAGVQAAIASGRRAKALARVSDDEWRTKAVGLGAQRIGPGMMAAVDKHSREFAPYRETLSGVNLPPRTTDGMTNLTQRAGAIVQAMMNKKRELKG